ncbi:MAG: DMT family transporter [Litoreibacter sp.]
MDRTLIIAVISIAFGMSLIPLGDTFGKAMLGLGVAPLFVAFARYFLGSLLLIPFTGIRNVLPLIKNWRVWFRAGLQVGAVLSILTSLQTESLANAFGAFFAGPMVSYLLSAWLLGEKITWARTVLLIIGFCGVLLVVKPGFAMTTGLAFAALGGFFYGAFLTTSRWLSTLGRSQDLMLSQVIIGAVFLAPVGMLNLPNFTFNLSLLLIGSGAASMLGNLLIVLAYARAPASILAPFVYVQLVSAMMLGFVIFGDWPDPISLMGLTLIFFSGAATLAFSRPKRATKHPTP